MKEVSIMAASIKLKRMVQEIDREFSLEPYIRDSFLTIDREVFVPDGFGHFAYKLEALPISASQWISSPLTVAKMTQYLELRGADSVLEIGCGSGYQAAILSKICRRVFTIERIDTLLKSAKVRFSNLGINNVFTRFDDGQRGWRGYAPYDRILFSATAKEIPQVLFDQLAEGGILIAPIEVESKEIIKRFFKKNGRIISEEIESCRFVPILDGTEK
jgi:protein-L-isoaspartate(D-aspartate) O-methyltransferase